MARRRSMVEHVVAEEGGARIRCAHCGKVLRLALPMNFRVWVAAGEEFVKVHRWCKPPRKEKETQPSA